MSARKALKQKRGRKPKPRALRVLEGNPGKRPLPAEDLSANVLGEAPPTLTQKLERDTWTQVRSELWWLREADRSLLEIYCKSWCQMELAHNRILVLLVSDAPSDEYLALQRLMDKSRDTCIRILSEVGGTTTSRVRVSRFGELETKPSDPVAKYLA